jgi:hypothetical protein
LKNFTSDKVVLHKSLNALKKVAYGDIRLYDSLSDVITRTFWQNADPSRPWVLIVVVDGNDNLSVMSPEQCSGKIYDKYTRKGSNFMFVVGVGNRVNANRMKNVSKKES